MTADIRALMEQRDALDRQIRIAQEQAAKNLDAGLDRVHAQVVSLCKRRSLLLRVDTRKNKVRDEPERRRMLQIIRNLLEAARRLR